MKNNFPRAFGRIAGLSVLALWATLAFGGGRTGTGGDPACPAILRQARHLGAVLLGSRGTTPLEVCREVLGGFAAAGQDRGCFDLLFHARAGMVQLVREITADVECTKRIVFWDSLVQGPLEVGEEGEVRRVLARTEPTLEGPITFDLDRTLRVGASALFETLAHEILHKVRWQGRPIDDALAREFAFDSAHHLIGVVSEVLLRVAVQEGRVRDAVVVADTFTCDVVNSRREMSVESIGVRGPLVPVSSLHDPEGYSVGIGLTLGPKKTRSELGLEKYGLRGHHFYLRVDEPAPCGPDNAVRKSELGLLARNADGLTYRVVDRVSIPRAITESCPGDAVAQEEVLSVRVGDVAIHCRFQFNETIGVPVPQDLP